MALFYSCVKTVVDCTRFYTDGRTFIVFIDGSHKTALHYEREICPIHGRVVFYRTGN